MGFMVSKTKREGKEYTLEEALAHAQRLLASQERSASDMMERLTREGYPQNVSDEVVSRCLRCGLIDDSRFAELFVHRKMASGWGRERIGRELERHGIESYQVECVLGSLEPTLEIERALSLLMKRTISGKNPYQTAMRRLISKGFSIECAKSAVEMYYKTYRDH
ncbi:MAG: regulatory protein RecX [Actinobacteria bacterium]|nr:regulatory protein RecX [Actinomycetota bacterium]